MIESVDRRILSAFVCVDAITGSSVINAMAATETTRQWVLKPNRNGVYVIFDGPGLDALTGQFLPSGTWPDPVSFEVSIQDPNRRYLPRRTNVKAPMKVPTIGPAPAGSATNPAAIAALSDPTTVFDPQKVTVYPVPSAPIAPNWAVIHVSIVSSGTTPPKGLPWAVVQMKRNPSDTTSLATSQADANGEALLAVPGLTTQLSTSGTGPVTVSTIGVTIQAFFDPSFSNQPPGWIPNPDDILSNLSNPALKSSSQTMQIGAGQELLLSLAISV